ncbi:hypothetical protein [Mycobacterium uberis]|uniref:hypothetical protein n=1 Tax=Mycobacterium uberis TaxID=2162698 RepID=UPI0024364B50|nr:hypothetical protein [Mycobacterium uberis]
MSTDAVDGRRSPQLAAVAEQFSQHSLRRAIVEEARTRGIAIPAADDFHALPRRGAHIKHGT